MDRCRKWKAALFSCLAAACLLCLAGCLSPARAAEPLQSIAPDGTPYYLIGPDLIYVTATGECYHCVDDCGNTKRAYLLSLAEACRLGYRPCGRCKPPMPVIEGEPVFPSDSIIVYIAVGNKYYHRKPNCSGLQDAVAVVLDEALYLERKPCKKCNAPTQP